METPEPNYGEPPRLPSTPPPLPQRVPAGSPVRPFKRWVTLCFVVLYAALLVTLYFPVISGSALSYWWYPARTSFKVVDVALAEAHSGGDGLSHVFQLGSKSVEEVNEISLSLLEQIQRQLGSNDIATDRGLPGVARAILLGEIGKTNEARSAWEEVGRIPEREELGRLGVQVVNGEPVDADDDSVYASLAFLEDGWLYMRFRAAVAQASGKFGDAADWRRSADDLGERIRLRGMVSSIAFLIALIAGIIAVPFVIRWKPPAELRPALVGGSAAEGVGIWIRGEFFGLLLVSVISGLILAELQWHFSCITSLVRGLPLIMIAWARFNGAGVGLSDGFALRIPPGCGPRLLAFAMALFAMDLAAAYCLGAFFAREDDVGQMAESTRELLIYGPVSNRFLALLDGVVFAPVVEELAYRAILFRGLRSRFGFAASASISSATFAVMHFYGLYGFLSVFAFGFISSWVLEKTKSLLPSILGHSLVNLGSIGIQFLYFL